jgi:hypothetical protein
MLVSLFLAASVCVGQREGPPEDTFKAPASWRALGPSIWFDAAGRRLIVRARVCLRDGYLEHLLCRERTKEHEAILATPAPPRMIHAGLILAVGDPGRTVQYTPSFRLPEGPKVKIDLEWEENGKTQTADAKSWVMDEKTKKALEVEWVFAGSTLFKDPETGEMIYSADAGDLITVANFPSAILDVPFRSTNNDAERLFVANTRVIPKLDTYVSLVFRAVDGAKAPAAPGRPAASKTEPPGPAKGAAR